MSLISFLLIGLLLFTPIWSRIGTRRVSRLSTRIYLLPSFGIVNEFRQISPVASNFRRMVDRFSNYTTTDIDALVDDRLKLLVLGGKDALKEEKVLKAFEILYEDIMPVRFGGDILFNLLDKSIRSRSQTATTTQTNVSAKLVPTSSSQLKRRIIKQIAKISRTQEGNVDCFASILFPVIDDNSDGSITQQEFAEWVESIVITEGDDVFGLFSEIDKNNDGTICFDEFKFWTTGAFQHHEDCDLDMSTDVSHLQNSSLSAAPSKKNSKHHDRYQYMVKCFAEAGEKWVEKVGPSRVDLIISGCFAGAKNPGVVTALGILYEDYSPLRMAGDIIFKLVESKIKT